MQLGGPTKCPVGSLQLNKTSLWAQDNSWADRSKRRSHFAA